MFNNHWLRRATLIAFVFFGSVTASWADQSGGLAEWIAANGNVEKHAPNKIMQRNAPGPNPWLTFRPEGAQTDWSYWTLKRNAMAAEKAAKMSPANARIKAKKKNGKTTLFVRGFGTNPNKADAVDIYAESKLPPVTIITPNPEDEGSIILATTTSLISGGAIKASARISDGPFGSAGTRSGDVDFFMIPNVKTGQMILIDVDTPDPFYDLDPFVVLYDQLGNIIDFNDDDGESFDSYLSVVAPADGDYYVSITGFGTFALDDPFDSSSGPGWYSEGEYDITIGLDYFDEMFVSFKLRKRDILGVSLSGLPGKLSLTDKSSLERQGSGQDLTFIHPEASPLPSGEAALSHAVDRTGKFTLRVLPARTGNYTVSLRVFRNPLLAGSKGDVQTVFVDFDGETIDTGALFFGLPPGFVISTLSPLVDFLPGWGLTANDEDVVIDAILAHLRESLFRDIKRRGREPNFHIRILNSRDHADPFGRPNVSRIIVGGTIPELQIGTIAIAESIDVGNFETKETGVVLLDLLSAPAGNPNSLNSIPRAPGVSLLEVIGAGVGNISAHEAGHYLGNWHTDQFNAYANIMDQGGNLENTVGVGPDGIFGTADDDDVDFGVDIFVPNEGFTGFEDTLNSIAIGSPAPRSNRQ